VKADAERRQAELTALAQSIGASVANAVAKLLSH